MKCVAMIKKMMDKAKGQKRTALKNSLENLMKQEIPQQVSEIQDAKIASLKEKIKEVEQEKIKAVEKCSNFWKLQMSSMPKHGKATSRSRPGFATGRK